MGGEQIKYAILIRHAESEKNVASRFSGAKDLGLTVVGSVEAKEYAIKLTDAAAALGSLGEVYSANSSRALQTARPLADQIGRGVRTLNFRSIDLGLVSGLSEKEAQQAFPDFFQDLMQYRAGLKNSYSIRFPPGAEDPHAFEREMFQMLDAAIKGSVGDVSFFVMHRSPMTAVLISALRSSGAYPHDFYGHLTIDHLSPFVLRWQDDAYRLHSIGFPVKPIE